MYNTYYTYYLERDIYICLREAPPKKKRENVGILKKTGGGGSTQIPLLL